MKFKSNQVLYSKEKLNLPETPTENTENSSLKPVASKEDVTFPMKHFKGTKAHLKNKKINRNSSLKRKQKLVLYSQNNTSSENDKSSVHDPLELMGKLEKFSDVWNDCSVDENPPKKYSNEYISYKPNNKLFTKQKEDRVTLNTARRYEKTCGLIANNERISKVKRKIDMDISLQNNHMPSKACNERYTMSSTFQDKLNKQVTEDLHVKSGIYDSKLADLKRKKALQGQREIHSNQKSIIKEALSSLDKKHKMNKRVVFSDVENEDDFENKCKEKNHLATTKKLFDDDLSDFDLELSINSLFEEKKGQQLLKLQSKFGSDSRFTLDSRFNENEPESDEKEKKHKNVDQTDEMKKQLAILETIVKRPLKPLSELRKEKLNTRKEEKWMIRFDPTREDHQKYILKAEKPSKEDINVKEKRKKLKRDDTSYKFQQDNKPHVSNEKVYAVKEDLKKVLKNGNQIEFSFLKLFGPKDENSVTQQDYNESKNELKYIKKNPFRYDSSESDDESEENNSIKTMNEISVYKSLVPSWKTTFFVMEKDSRLQESLDFLKVPEETGDCQDYAEKRKVLKDFIRHKLKNSNRKKTIFKKKLGGLKKKFDCKRKRS